MGSNTPALPAEVPRPGDAPSTTWTRASGRLSPASRDQNISSIAKACWLDPERNSLLQLPPPPHPSILNRTAEVGIGSCPLLSKVSGLCCASPFLRPPFPAPARAPIRASLSCSLAYRPNCLSSTPARRGSVLAAPFSSRCGPTDWEPRSRLFLAPLPSGCSMESSPAPWPVAAG